MGETSDIFRLNFICVSVKQVIHGLSEQLPLDTTFLIDLHQCAFFPLFLSEWGLGRMR